MTKRVRVNANENTKAIRQRVRQDAEDASDDSEGGLTSTSEGASSGSKTTPQQLLELARDTQVINEATKAATNDSTKRHVIEHYCRKDAQDFYNANPAINLASGKRIILQGMVCHMEPPEKINVARTKQLVDKTIVILVDDV